MKPAPFAYHAPDKLSEAIALLSAHGNAKLLAGGQSLMPMLNMRFSQPDHIIDLNPIEALSGISAKGGAIEIGAMTRQSTLEASQEIAANLPVMTLALGHVGHFQTRSRGTIGGSLCHLDPAAELPAVCLLHDAGLSVAGPRGTRSLPISEWFRGFMQPALEPDEILTSIRIPCWPLGHGFGFAEFSRRHGDFAIAGAAALLTLTGAGTVERCAIVAFGIETGPRRLYEAERKLTGAAPDDKAFQEASSSVASLNAIGDAIVSSAYRKKVGAVMVRRALAAAYGQAKKSQQGG